MSSALEIQVMNASASKALVGRRSAIFAALVCALMLTLACSRPYRVGDHVLVEWGDESLSYPAFIIERKSKTRFRVHYDGYPARWDEEVGLPRIKGWVSGEVPRPPPPKKVRLARGLDANDQDTPVSPFKEGDKIRVRWRESDYRATVLRIVSAKEIEVHYDGHENAWDEVIPVSRVVVSP